MVGVENGIGLNIVLWLQSLRTPLLDSIFKPVDFLGSVTFFLLIIPLIYWSIDAAFGRRLIVVFLMSAWANLTLKEWWQRPRPFQVSDRVQALVEETTFGLPSGDVQNATVVWGMLAARFKRNWLTALAVVYVAVVALARMILGVHFPQDVLVGALLGLAFVGVTSWLEPRLAGWLGRQSVLAQIGWVVVITAALGVLHPILVEAHNEAALEFATVAIGAFLGIGVGLALETRYVRFEAGGDLWKRVVRYVLGVAVVFGLRVGLGAAFEGLEPAAVLRVVHYAIIGLWLGCGAPWLFVLSGLAERQTHA
jgi:membrane-associated phospholipid phosphatase